MNHLPWNAFRDWLFNLHKSLGFVVLGLVIIRFIYRLTHRPPPLPASIPPYQRVKAEIIHTALYVLLFAMAIIGWVGTNAHGEPMNIF